MSSQPSIAIFDRLRTILLRALVGPLLLALRITPWPLRQALARFAGRQVALRQRKRHQAARINLDLAFGDALPPARKEALVIECFQSFIGCLLDGSALIPTMNERNWRRIVDIPQEDIDTLAVLHQENKGVLVMFSHFGAWELMGAAMPFISPHQVHVVAKRQSPWVNPFIEGFRTSTGNKVIYKEGAVRAILRALKRNELVGISIDQNFSRGIFVPFFGVKAGTVDTLAALARASGAPIVPLVCTPKGDGSYQGRLLPAIHAHRTDDKQADLITTTRACFQVLEELIRTQPKYWLWGHKRWKSRPPEEQPPKDIYASRAGE